MLQVRLTFPFKGLLAQLSAQELHSKPGGAKGAALFGVLIFCLLPLLIGPCSGLSAEISPVTSYNSPLPAAGSSGAGCISITSKKNQKKQVAVQQSTVILLSYPIRVLSRPAISAAVLTFRSALQGDAGPFVLHGFSRQVCFWFVTLPLKHSSLLKIYCEIER